MYDERLHFPGYCWADGADDLFVLLRRTRRFTKPTVSGTSLLMPWKRVSPDLRDGCAHMARWRSSKMTRLTVSSVPPMRHAARQGRKWWSRCTTESTRNQLVNKTYRRASYAHNNHHVIYLRPGLLCLIVCHRGFSLNISTIRRRPMFQSIRIDWNVGRRPIVEMCRE